MVMDVLSNVWFVFRYVWSDAIILHRRKGFAISKPQPKQIASNGQLQHSHECPEAKKRLIIAAMACNNLWLEPDRVLLFFNSSKTKCALPFRDSITVLGFASILPFFKQKAWKLHWLLKRSVWKAVMIGVCEHARLAIHYALYACAVHGALKVGFESLWCGTCLASCLRW